MKKGFIIVLSVLFVSIYSHSQVTIGSDLHPHESAILDMKNYTNDKGFLGPRVALNSRDISDPVINPAKGLLVLSTQDSPEEIPDEFKVYANKFYYWSGTEWIEFIDQKRLESILSEELNKLGVPRIAFFNLIGTDVISGSGSTAKFGIKDFMKGIKIGNSKYVPIVEVANHTGGPSV